MNDFPLSQVYQLLEPGPVVLLTTADRGRANVMTLSWHMVVEFEPPLLACVVSSDDFSFAALRATGECVIAIPALELAAKTVEIGNVSGSKLDKFQTFGLTPVPAEQVAAPLIAECIANLECRVVDSRLVDTYNLFVMEVVQAWHDPEQAAAKTFHHQGYGRFVVDGDTLELASKMR
ncbi:flavin reductase family protein [Methylomonas sp. LL1]|uniref:flavin reductase family protein n=1 Tax=Methylomonas sp. LL1 TaxID=2785785 RepID=UPI0018C446E7|nr:flavin reductase family protein [Methylomonas sp. LL1]QPK62485.1 flavin reductase family protein [Methylomonas sp. LL1]